MTATTILDDYRDLLERPSFADLAAVRRDSTSQVNVTCSGGTANHLRLTYLVTRQKHRKLKENPAAAISVMDPDSPYCHLKVSSDANAVNGTFATSAREIHGDQHLYPSSHRGNDGNAPVEHRIRAQRHSPVRAGRLKARGGQHIPHQSPGCRSQIGSCIAAGNAYVDDVIASHETRRMLGIAVRSYRDAPSVAGSPS